MPHTCCSFRDEGDGSFLFRRRTGNGLPFEKKIRLFICRCLFFYAAYCHHNQFGLIFDLFQKLRLLTLSHDTPSSCENRRSEPMPECHKLIFQVISSNRICPQHLSQLSVYHLLLPSGLRPMHSSPTYLPSNHT